MWWGGDGEEGNIEERRNGIDAWRGGLEEME
jgi:hypothetical protein